NAKTVENGGAIQCPTLMFSSNGKDQEKDWVENQQKFAQIMGAKLVSYDCAHYIHQYKSDDMQKEIVEFVNALKK
ncbi:MAG: alpha/beta hydrolase, partial [Clostridia bacterium]|nr:alpha/beta hydrolase [Clostridia bacterium]